MSVFLTSLYLDFARVGGFHRSAEGGSKNEVVVLYFEPLTTQKLKSSGFPEGSITGQYRLRLFCYC